MLTIAFSGLALICRLPDGLPLVLYLPRVDSWAYGKVQLQAQGVECSPADNAPEKQLQHPPAASPFRCAAISSQSSEFQHETGVEHVAPFILPCRWNRRQPPIRRNAAGNNNLRAPIRTRK